MKIRFTLIAGIGAVALLGAGLAMAEGLGAGISGSPHDFTDNKVLGVAGPPNIENDTANSQAWNNKRKEICRVCHVPHDHGSVRYGNNGILWNHQLSTKTSWVMYKDGATLNPDFISDLQGIQAAAPSGVSKLCLGCHDGVSAINQYDNKTPADAGYGNGTTYLMGDIDAGFAIGNTAASLTNNHPISITYDNVNDTGLNDPAVATMRNGETVNDVLDRGLVQCSTCHDVHDGAAAVSGTHLLRESTKGADVTGANASALCLVCHNK